MLHALEGGGRLAHWIRPKLSSIAKKSARGRTRCYNSHHHRPGSSSRSPQNGNPGESSCVLTFAELLGKKSEIPDYNLTDDPSESKNLEDAHREIIEELVNELAKAFRDGRTTLGERQTNEGWLYPDGETAEQYPQLKGA